MNQQKYPKVAQPLVVSFVCGVLASVLWPALLYLFDSSSAVFANGENLLGAVGMAFIDAILFYSMAIMMLQASRPLRALVTAGPALIASVGAMLAIQYLYYPGMFALIPRAIIVDLSTLFVALFAASVISDIIFVQGRPLSNRGRSIVYSGFLSAALYLLVQDWLWGRDLAKAFDYDRFDLSVLCTAVAVDAMTSFWVAAISVAALKVKQHFVGHATRLPAAVLTGVLFYLEWAVVTHVMGESLNITFDKMLALGTPVFIAALIAYWVVWAFVRNASPVQTNPPKGGNPGSGGNRKRPPR
jgi:hypothetical protein